jgi:hypothetical protein
MDKSHVPVVIKKYKLDNMSSEQSNIYDIVKEGYNVIVDACAGSGKSTTILSIATKMPDRNFILITYNSMLCEETRLKVKDLELENINVYTFHGLAVKFYDQKAYVDSVIRKIVSKNKPLRNGIKPKVNVLVIDESQDMTFLYFKLIVKFCKDCEQVLQILILGDYMQGLYEFKGADIRFLTCADKIWNDFKLLKTQQFYKCVLKTSYRITRQMANFVNHAMLGDERLIACKDGPKVVYLRRRLEHAQIYVLNIIQTLIEEGAKYDEFFILGASVKGEKSYIRKMENHLVERGIPCHVPTIETTDKIDEKVIKNKVVFATFHAVKGRERKYVFIMGFDNSYFKFNARGICQYTCPNTLYVACTRATQKLVVIENAYNENNQLNFLKMNHHELKSKDYIDFQGMPMCKKTEDDNEDNSNTNIRHSITPTKLIQFISESVLEEINPILESIFIKTTPDNLDNINIPNIINTKNGLFEDVCDLNGITIPIVFFEKLQHCNTRNSIPNIGTHTTNGGRILIQLIDEDLDNLKDHEHKYLKKCRCELPRNCNTISEYLHIANLYVAVKEKLYFKYKQIEKDEYNWLTLDIMKECFKRMYETLGNECSSDNPFEIEKTIVRPNNKKINEYLSTFFPDEEFDFTARVDLVTNDSVWEIKCVNTVSNDHLIQVVIYAWIWRIVQEDIINLENIREFKLFNIKTGEIHVLNASTAELNTIIVLLLKDKFGKKETKIDEDFVIECQSYIHSMIL